MASYSDFEFNQVTQICTINIAESIITVQEIWDNFRRFSSEPHASMFRSMVGVTGKETLSATKKVGLTLVLRNWLIKFADRAGPSYTVCKIIDGNILAQTNYPTEPAVFADSPISPSDFVFGTWEADTSAALVDDVRLDEIAGLVGKNQKLVPLTWDSETPPNMLTGTLTTYTDNTLATVLAIYDVTATYEAGSNKPTLVQMVEQ